MTTAHDINAPRRRTWLTAISISTTLVAVACGAAEPPAPGTLPNPDATYPVIFEVTGNGPVDLMYRMYPKGPHDTAPVRCEGAINAAALPWSIQCDAAPISDAIVWASFVVQARGADVEFECRIRFRKTTRSQNKAQGRWAIAACSSDEIYWPWK